jgi:hypothetical protein
MKAYIPLIAVALVTACSTAKPPPVAYAPQPMLIEKHTSVTVANPNATINPAPIVYKLKGYEGPEAMSTHEVRQAQKLCILSKMQPVTQYISVRTDTGSKVQVPIGVDCEAF